jgi:four helix bundle protein
MKSYKDLEIYQTAYKFAIVVHKMTLQLPAYELYEQGSQVRRSTKSIKDNIAEGFGRRRYKDEFIRFLIFAQASCDEALSQLNMISEIHFSEFPLTALILDYENLGKKINKFTQYVETDWMTNKKQKPATRN